MPARAKPASAARRTRLKDSAWAACRALASALALLAGWRLLSVAGGRFLPPPEKVLPFFAREIIGSLGAHALASAGRTALAILISSAAALPAGIALGRIAWLDRLASPIVYLLHPLPKIAFLPLLLAFLGLGNESKVAVMVLILYFQILVSARDGAKAIDPGHFRTAAALGLGPLSRFARVILPAMLPAFFSGLRTAAGTAVSVLFFAESVSATKGLGFYVMDAWMRVAYADMSAGILALGALGLGLFILIDAAEWILCPWTRAER